MRMNHIYNRDTISHYLVKTSQKLFLRMAVLIFYILGIVNIYQTKSFGDILIVGLNSDASVPIKSEIGQSMIKIFDHKCCLR